MVVRIRLKRRPVVRTKRSPDRNVALAFSALLIPASLMAFALAIWGLAAERKWTGEFPISSGPFAGWESWVAAAALLQIFAALLNRYGRGGAARP